MFPNAPGTVSVSISKSSKFMLFRVRGFNELPLRFELINLDGKKVRSVELLYGLEFVVQTKNLSKGEYLYALRSVNGLLQTGVVNI